MFAGLSCHTLTLHQSSQFTVLNATNFPILRHWYAVYPTGRQEEQLDGIMAWLDKTLHEFGFVHGMLIDYQNIHVDRHLRHAA